MWADRHTVMQTAIHCTRPGSEEKIIEFPYTILPWLGLTYSSVTRETDVTNFPGWILQSNSHKMCLRFFVDEYLEGTVLYLIKEMTLVSLWKEQYHQYHALGPSPRTTRASRYQKKHSPLTPMRKKKVCTENMFHCVGAHLLYNALCQRGLSGPIKPAHNQSHPDSRLN